MTEMQFIVLQRKIIVEMSNFRSIVVISSTSEVHSDISDFDHSLRYLKHSKQMFGNFFVLMEFICDM